MGNPLGLPAGVRLPGRDELTGSRSERDRLWAQVEKASFRPGFVARPSESPEFAWFFEVNVDADGLWSLLVALVGVLFLEGGPVALQGSRDDPEETGPICQLLFSDADEELAPVGAAPLGRILQLLEEIRHQLAHDGWIQFGLVQESAGRVTGVLVTPTKHLQVWVQEREGTLGVLCAHGLEEAEELEFLASYPVVVELPPDPPDVWRRASELQAVLRQLLAPGGD